jgi:cysteine synthase A
MNPCILYSTAADLANSFGGIYRDQFTNAKRVTDWRGNNNIAESLFGQMRAERHPVPALIVMSVGTGGTTATIGRYIRYRRHMTRVCAVDVEYSVFFDSFVRKDRSLTGTRGSRIEGIGRPDGNQFCRFMRHRRADASGSWARFAGHADLRCR